MISDERVFTSVAGAGVQYLPGHVEDFIDLVLNKYISTSGDILELGGGGLRFAFPAASRARVTVVDLDAAGLDVDAITKKVHENGKVQIDLPLVKKNIFPIISDALTFLEKDKAKYSLIATYRMVHFFSPKMIDDLFSLAKARMHSGALFAISGISFYELPFKERFNQLYINSSPIKNNEYYRGFFDNEFANSIRNDQNLGDRMHFFDSSLITNLAKKHGFDVVLSGYPSTGIVEGYILKATD